MEDKTGGFKAVDAVGEVQEVVKAEEDDDVDGFDVEDADAFENPGNDQSEENEGDLSARPTKRPRMGDDHSYQQPRGSVAERPVSQLMQPCLNHFRKGRMELDDVVEYIRDLVKDGDRAKKMRIFQSFAGDPRNHQITPIFAHEWEVSEREMIDYSKGKKIPKKITPNNVK